MLKKLSKQKISDIITYGIVLVAFIVMQILINAGQISSLFEGLMVPLCTYIILAISLNLVVGVLGELSLGHAGFMCVGAFTSAFFSKCMQKKDPAFTESFVVSISTYAIFIRPAPSCPLPLPAVFYTSFSPGTFPRPPVGT